MKIVFRVDASVQIGSGHVIRCLTLADSLRARQADVQFICRNHTGNLIDMLKTKGYDVTVLPAPSEVYKLISGDVAHASLLGVSWETDASETLAVMDGMSIDWLIVDHYALDRRWEAFQRPYVARIMVIDDLADRDHDCDILLDQNYYPSTAMRYAARVPAQCMLLLGPRYLLLAPEFEKHAAYLKKRSGTIQRVLVFFGSTDPTGETLKALDAIQAIGTENIHYDVIVGMNNPQRNEIHTRCERFSNLHYYCQTSEMAKLCSLSDLALGAGGSAIWERSSLALPSLVIITARNQRETTLALAESGCIKLLGWYEHISSIDIADALRWAIHNPDVMFNCGIRARALMELESHMGAAYVSQTIMASERIAR